MKLRHIHLPNLTPYNHASALQERLVSSLLLHKAQTSSSSSTTTNKTPPPPTVITAQFSPVYTCGRREIGTITPAQRTQLTAPTPWGSAQFFEARRGGQTTFHGPGQMTAYAVLDLKRHGLSARCYVHLLERVVMETCGVFGVKAGRTGNPGVWVLPDGKEGGKEEKICAVGVHLRRNVSSHGVGLNVSTELGWFERVVACGLEGLGTTSLARQGANGAEVEEVGDVFVRQLAEALKGVDGVVRVGEDEVD